MCLLFVWLGWGFLFHVFLFLGSLPLFVGLDLTNSLSIVFLSFSFHSTSTHPSANNLLFLLPLLLILLLLFLPIFASPAVCLQESRLRTIRKATKTNGTPLMNHVSEDHAAASDGFHWHDLKRSLDCIYRCSNASKEDGAPLTSRRTWNPSDFNPSFNRLELSLNASCTPVLEALHKSAPWTAWWRAEEVKGLLPRWPFWKRPMQCKPCHTLCLCACKSCYINSSTSLPVD